MHFSFEKYDDYRAAVTDLQHEIVKHDMSLGFENKALRLSEKCASENSQESWDKLSAHLRKWDTPKGWPERVEELTRKAMRLYQPIPTIS